jgi:8-oxo-dGTP pyrophosphatase MutT (NUDIX family)
MASKAKTTWDGLPASTDKPFGAIVVVFRRKSEILEFLVLHRAHHGIEYEGNWAWTPPSGCRFPDEPIVDCAERELYEEAGLKLNIKQVSSSVEDWVIYTAEASMANIVELIDLEHDKFVWLTYDEAIKKCHPKILKDQFILASKSVNYPEIK